MPPDNAAILALLLTCAIAFGGIWAAHARAQTDLQAAKTGLDKARQAAGRAKAMWWACLIIVAIIGLLWLRHHDG